LGILREISGGTIDTQGDLELPVTIGNPDTIARPPGKRSFVLVEHALQAGVLGQAAFSGKSNIVTGVYLYGGNPEDTIGRSTIKWGWCRLTAV